MADMADKDEFHDILVNDEAEAAPNDEDKTRNDGAPEVVADTDFKPEVIEVDHNKSEEIDDKNEDEENVMATSLIRPQRTSSARTLKIVSTEERRGRVQKHTVYIIECDPPPSGVITVARRYNDFKWLRNTLSASFPGLFIPPLPPANVIGRFEDSFVEERRQDLERFLNRIECIQALSASMAFGMFLSRPETTFFEGRKEVDEMISARSDSDVCAVLCKLFPDLSDLPQLNESVHSSDVPAVVEFFSKIDAQMTLLNKSAVRLFKHLNFVSSEMLSFESAFEGLYAAESNYPYKATSERLDVQSQLKLWAQYQTKQTDAYYDNFFRSLRYEHEDIRALLELFRFHDAKYKKYQKVCRAIDKWNEMEANGKAPLKPSHQRQKSADKEERKELLQLLNIGTQIMLKNEIIYVWNHKTNAWSEKIQNFAKILTQITIKMINEWKNVELEHDEHDENDANVNDK
eukprot:158540_1